MVREYFAVAHIFGHHIVYAYPSRIAQYASLILKDGMSEYPVFKTGSSESFPMVEALSSLLILNQEVTGI